MAPIIFVGEAIFMGWRIPVSLLCSFSSLPSAFLSVLSFSSPFPSPSCFSPSPHTFSFLLSGLSETLILQLKMNARLHSLVGEWFSESSLFKAISKRKSSLSQYENHPCQAGFRDKEGIAMLPIIQDAVFLQRSLPWRIALAFFSLLN